MGIDWYVAMSLPLGLMASLLLLCIPLIISVKAPERIDGPNAILVGVWVAGLMVQCGVTFACLHRRNQGLKLTDEGPEPTSQSSTPVTLTVGGVWTTMTSRLLVDDDDHDAADSAMSLRIVVMWSMILLALVLMVLACVAVDSVSSVSVDRPWIAAAWIFGLQFVWQSLPLPQSLGRTGWSIVIGWVTSTGSRADDIPSDPRDSQSSDHRANAVLGLRRVRWCVIGLAFLSLIAGVIAIQASGISGESGGQPFPVFAGVVLLSLWLFASSRNEDLFATQLTLAENGETGQLHGKIGIRSEWQRWRERQTERANVERLRAAAVREQSEASDAAKVDGILQRMHESGVDSLTKNERNLLKRVSEAIRRQRERDGQ